MEFLAGTGGAQTFGPCLRGPEDVRQLIVLASCFGLVLSTIDIDIAVRCRDFGRRLRKSRDRRLWGYGQPAQLGRNPPPRSAADCDRRAFYFIRVRYVRRLTRLAFLSPRIVEAIVTGHQPPELTAKALTERIELPLFWSEQERVVGIN